MTDCELIDRLGGPARVAERLGLPKIGGVQRVHNWRQRGIPARVKLQHPEVFLRGAATTEGADSAEQAANAA